MVKYKILEWTSDLTSSVLVTEVFLLRMFLLSSFNKQEIYEGWFESIRHQRVVEFG